LARTHVEYATDQITVYPNCPYGCKYCWANTPLMRSRARNPKPIEEAERYARARKKRTIVISFTSDPYPPQEIYEQKTKQVLKILLPTQHKIMILTKSDLVHRDYPLLRRYDNVWVGMTVTALTWIPDEPYAPSNPERMQALRIAHDLGIKTWISIEPSIPGITDWVEIIKETHSFVDWYVLGRLDYETRFGYPKIPEGYYIPKLEEAEELLRSLGKPYHIKSQLARNP